MRDTATGNNNSQKPDAGMRTTPATVSRPKSTVKETGIPTPARSSRAASRPSVIATKPVNRNQKKNHWQVECPALGLSDKRCVGSGGFHQ